MYQNCRRIADDFSPKLVVISMDCPELFDCDTPIGRANFDRVIGAVRTYNGNEFKDIVKELEQYWQVTTQGKKFRQPEGLRLKE